MTSDVGDADLAHLVARRGLTVPDQDRADLVAYWSRIRALRAEVDPQLLGDAEIALSWTAVPPSAG